MLEQFVYVLVSLLLVGSVYVWLQVFRQWQENRPILPFRSRRQIPRHWVILIWIVVLWVGVPQLLQWLLELEQPAALRKIILSCLSGIVILLVVPPLLTEGRQRSLADFGITLREWPQQIRDGIGGFVASFLPVLLVLYSTRMLRTEETQHEFLSVLQNDPTLTTILWITTAAVIIAPLVEELIFRVVLQGWLQSRIAPTWAILIVAVLFSAVHRWPDSLALFPLALVLGYIYYQRYSYLAVVMIHSLFNGVNILIALMMVKGDGGEGKQAVWLGRVLEQALSVLCQLMA